MLGSFTAVTKNHGNPWYLWMLTGLAMRVMLGAIKDGIKKGRGGQEIEWVACVKSDPTKLETRRPRCSELDRNSRQGRAGVYDQVEEGGRREVQNPPGEEHRQIAREPSTNMTE